MSLDSEGFYSKLLIHHSYDSGQETTNLESKQSIDSKGNFVA